MRGVLILLFQVFICLTIVGSTKVDSSATKQWEVKLKETIAFGKENLNSNTDSVIQRNKNILNYIEYLSDDSLIFDLYNLTGLAYQTKTFVDSSSYYFSKAYNIALKNNDTSQLITIKHNEAINLRLGGNIKNALEQLFKNIELCKNVNNDRFYGLGLSEIANCFMLLNNWSKSLEYQYKAIGFHRSKLNYTQLGTAYGSLSYIYMNQEYPNYNTDSSLKYVDSSIFYFNKTNDSLRLAQSMSQKCSIYSLEGDTRKSTDCLTDVWKLQKQLGSKEGVLVCELNIGINYSILKNYKKGNEFLYSALKKSKKLEKERFEQYVYKNLALNYFETNNFKKAYLYLDSSHTLKNKLQGEDLNKEMADLEAKYQLADKERTILKEQQNSQKLEQEKEVANLEVEKKNTWLISLIILLIISALAVFLFIQNKNKKQALKEEKLVTQEKQNALKAVIEAQEEERKRIAKDLHDGIGQKLSGLKMGLNRIAKESEGVETKNRINELSEVLMTTAEEIRAISHKMMPVALREVGLSAALISMLENTFKFSEMTYTYDEVNAEGRFDEKVEVTIYRIAQELINNAIKHAQANEINVQLIKVKAHLVLIVQDDGKGIDINEFKKGHGYMNINSRLSVSDGEINLESNENQGLFAQVRIRI